MQPIASEQHTESRAAKTIRDIFESGRPVTYIRSAEEQRVAKALREVGRRLRPSTPIPVWTWTLTEGCVAGTNHRIPGTLTPRGALDFIAAHTEPAIFHLKDFHEPFASRPRPGAASEIYTRAVWIRRNMSSSVPQSDSFPRRVERSHHLSRAPAA